MAEAAMKLQFDPTDRAVIDNPFPLFRRLRRDAPVHWSDRLRGWVVTRHADCKAISLDRRFSSERMRPFFEALEPEARARVDDLESSIGLWAVFLDPPDHTRLRRLLNRGFTSRAVDGMERRIAAIVNEQIDRVAGRGEADFIADIAYRIPATVIMEMLGAPAADIENFKVWSDEIGLFVGTSRVTDDKYARAEAATEQMAAAFRDLIRERRRKPRADMISDLIAAEDAGDVLNEEELVATCILLLFAGHETTGNLLGNGMYHFIHHPAQYDRLRTQPDLAERAVEEILRFDGPSGAVVRVAGEDLEFAGQPIRRGERVFAFVNAANRDDAVFDDPERFDITRGASGQLAFGHGIHFCIGAPLARLEGRIAFPIFAERLRHPRLVGEEPAWIDSVTFRGLTRLPIAFDPA